MHQFNIVFDYRFDTNGFFSDPQRKATLESAAQIWTNLIQDDFPDISAGLNFTVTDPQTKLKKEIHLDQAIDDLVIFVGARTGLGGDSVGEGGFDGTDAAGTIFSNRLKASNFEPWAGTIAFDTSTNWFFDATPQTDTDIPNSSVDFLSVALHEIGHVLGLSTASIFQKTVSGSGSNRMFQGVNAKAVNQGKSIPLTSDSRFHVKNGFVLADNQEVLMDPTLNSPRKRPTLLDLALLADIGYQISPFNGFTFTPQGSTLPLATSGNDTLFGTIFDDVIDGLGGNDQIQGDLGNDTLIGGLGKDTIFGNEGDDHLSGGEGNDALQGGTGNDAIQGGTGNDTIFGEEGNDTLGGEAGNDALQGGIGNDTLQGGAGNDTLVAQAGNDVLEGGDGDDQLFGGEGNSQGNQIGDDQLFGGAGQDTLAGEGGDDTLSGEAGNDLLLGGIGNDTLQGGTGNDSVQGGSGNDFLQGEGGDDLLLGEEGDDNLSGGEGNDQLQGGAGNDFLGGDGGADILFGEEGDDKLFGGEGNDQLQGGKGNDQLRGGTGNDTLFGQDGSDTLSGGTGNDALLGGLGNDIFFIEAGNGQDRIGMDTDLFNPATEKIYIAAGLGLTAQQVFNSLTRPFSNITKFTLSPGNTIDVIHAPNSNPNATPLTVTNFVIVDDNLLEPGTIAFNTASYSINEDGTATTAITLNRTNGSNGAISVKVNLTDGTASALNDYNNTPITVTFAPGETRKTITIPVVNDNVYESSETINLTLGNPTGGAALGTISSAIVNIIDNDAKPVITLSANQTIVEGVTSPQTLSYTVSLSNPSSQTITVQYATANGTAQAGLDYTSTIGTLTFSPGITSQVVNIPILNDSVNEIDETFILNLTHATNAILGATPTAITTLTDTLSSATTTTLPTNVENLTLTGNGTINGTGNAGNNILLGNSANNTLNGGAGNDSLTGGKGNDTLNGELGSDQVVESGDVNFILTNSSLMGNGTDTLSSIEQAKLTGGVGNNILNASAFSLGSVTLSGGAGNDTLLGGANSDILTGGVGNDSLVGGNGTDRVVETGDVNFTLTNSSLTGNGTDTLSSIEQASLTGGVGNNTFNASAFSLGSVTLSGGAGNDTLIGGNGNDVLVGGGGNDSLSGGLGSDRFTFNSPTEGIDQITDFLSSQGDKISVSASRFGGGLVAGVAITNAQFVLGSAAIDASDRFIYNQTNGHLLFDSDGTGSLAAIQFAVLSTKPALTFTDILVFA